MTRLAAGYLADMPTAQDDDSLLASAERGLARGYAEVMAQPWMKRALPLLVIAYAGAAVAGVVLTQATRGVELSLTTNRPELERRFPKIEFFGPVRFEPRAGRRREALAKVLSPLVSRGQPTRAK